MEVLNRPAIEREFRERFAALSDRHRDEALRLMGGQIDPRRLPPSFWEKVQEERERALFLLMLATFAQSAYEHTLRAAGVHPSTVQGLRQQAKQAGLALTPEERANAIHEMVGGAGLRLAQDRARELGTDFGPPGSPARRFLDQLANGPDVFGRRGGLPEDLPPSIILPAVLMAATGLSAAAIQFARPRAGQIARGMVITDRNRLAGKTREKAEVAFSGVFSGKRAEGAIRNEFTRAQTGGGEWTVRRLRLTNPGDVWEVHPEDSQSGPCPVCEPLDGTPRSFWERFFPEGPPEPHSGCCCTVRHLALLN